MPNIFDLVVSCEPPPPNGKARPPAKPEEPQAAPPSACKRFTGGPLEKGFPPPASEDFCLSIDQFGQVLDETYDNLINWIDGLDPVKAMAERFKLPLVDETFGGVWNTVARLWNTVVDAVASFGRWLFDLIKGVFLYVKDLHECLTQRCNSRASLAITLLRAVVRGLEKIRAGADPGVWLTADIAVEFKLINNWLDHAEAYFCPLEIPTAEEATHAWLLDRITEQHRDCIWRLHGYHPESYEKFAMVEREQLDWREAVQYVRRIRGGEDQEDGLLRKRGFVTTDDVLMAKEMYWELPTIADHLHWLQRNVFDTDYVRDYRLEEGFAEKFWPKFGPDLTALGMREEYARNHYAAHWIQPSPEQMREMVYRSQEIAALTGKGFTEDDYERILTEQDYSPLARKWFRAIIYQVPAISYIKEWYRQDIINKQELTEYHHRLGFSPKDAERFADIDDLQKRRMRASASKGWTTGAATSAWFTGLVTLERHDEIYRELGYDSREAQAARDVAGVAFNASAVKRAKTRALSGIISLVSQAVDVGVMSPQAAADNLRLSGWPKDQAEGFAGLMQQTGGIRKVKQAITYVRRHVIDGGITFSVAQQELQRLGLTSDAVANYLSLWRLQMTPGRKKRTASQIVADVASRHITTADAINRLVNLGYNDADTRLYLADAQAKLVKTQQGLLAAQQKKGLQAVKEQERLAKEMQRQRRQLQADMLKATPIKTLQSWAKKGIISHKRFVSRLMQMGWTKPDAELYYVESCKAKGSECTEAEPDTKGDGGGGGGGGSDGGGSEGGTGEVPQHG